MRVFSERIAQRSLIVHEKADRFGFQFVQIEPSDKADLHGQVGVLRIWRSAQGLGVRVEPLLNTALGTEP